MERDWYSAVAFLPSLGAGVVHQNTAHEARRKAVEMFAVFKFQAALAEKFQEQLIHHTRRLVEIFRALRAKESAGDLPELWIDKLEKVIDGGGLSLVPLAQKHRNFARLRQADKTFFGG